MTGLQLEGRRSKPTGAILFCCALIGLLYLGPNKPVSPNPQSKPILEWEIQNANVTSRLNDLHFVDEMHGWAVGSGGTVVATTNGGSTWRVVFAPDFPWWDFRGVFFVNPKKGWIVGREHFFAILSSSDGGRTWKRQYRGAPGSLNSVFFHDALRGWTTGIRGLVLHTFDGGSTWKRQSSGIALNLYEVYFVDPRRGWVVGEQGTVLHTANGGEKWSLQDSSTKRDLHDVKFVNQSIGWAVGDKGTILATKDGGQTWVAQQSTIESTLHSVFFANENRGVVVGQGGLILASHDGGKSWIREPSGTLNDLFRVYMIKSSAWLVGDKGLILKRRIE